MTRRPPPSWIRTATSCWSATVWGWLSTASSPVPGHVLGQGIQAASVGTQDAVQSLLDQAGLANLSFGSMSGMQLFWITAAALIALAAAGVMKLSQEA